MVERKAGCGKCDKKEDEGGSGDRKNENEEGSQEPGDGWIEKKPRLSGIPGRGSGPTGVIAESQLVGSVDPTLNVEKEIVSAGAMKKERVNGEESG